MKRIAFALAALVCTPAAAGIVPRQLEICRQHSSIATDHGFDRPNEQQFLERVHDIRPTNLPSGLIYEPGFKDICVMIELNERDSFIALNVQQSREQVDRYNKIKDDDLAELHKLGY